MYTAGCLNSIKHGFFTRNGGVSQGCFDSLNFAFSKGDTVANVAENRKRALSRLGTEDKKLLTMVQVHGNEVLVVKEEGWDFASLDTPHADAIVTQNSNVVIGILTADCVPVLLYDDQTQTIAAIHAGWKGAKAGIIESTFHALEKLNVKPQDVKAAIGPCISQENYEVGPEVFDAFQGIYNDCFAPSNHSNHYMFNLPKLVHQQLLQQGVEKVENLGLDTYQQKKDFFSCRRASHRGEKSYGCMLSAISLS